MLPIMYTIKHEFVGRHGRQLRQAVQISLMKHPGVHHSHSCMLPVGGGICTVLRKHYYNSRISSQGLYTVSHYHSSAFGVFCRL
jgi:hypothetical protein